MNPPLPPLPGVIPAAIQVPEVALVELSSPRTNRRYIIALSKDMTSTEQKLFESYGKLLFYDNNTMNNMDPQSFEFEYLVIDLRNKNDRYFFLKQIKPVEDNFYVLLHCHGFEVEDLSDTEHYDNILISFPMKQARKSDFDKLLLVHRLPKPRWWMSLASCLFQTYQKAK
jgi:hypothetical protein